MDMHGESDGPFGSGGYQRPQAVFRTLRRLHGQNLDHQGLNDLSEAFQNFVTRARFFSIGRIRRTWSHSAVEFMKYRRRLPALMADEGNELTPRAEEETDMFDDFTAHKSQRAKYDERKVVVGNVSARATTTQLASFFSKFGKISSCHIPIEGAVQSMYATMPKTRRSKGVAHITFKKLECATKAAVASAQDLKFYDKIMTVTPYPVYKSNRQKQKLASKGPLVTDVHGSVYSAGPLSCCMDDDRLSTTSSDFSAATDITYPESPIYHSLTENDVDIYIGGASIDQLPDKVLTGIFLLLPASDRIRVERVAKKWMELSVKSWNGTKHLRFSGELSSTKSRPLRNSALRCILRRCGLHLRSLDLSRAGHLLDDQSLNIVASECPNLIQIDMSGLKVRWTALKQFSERCPQLQSVAYRDQIDLGEKSFWYLFRNCANLNRIDLRGCRRLTGRCFRLLGLFLEQVLLDGCIRLEADAIEEICLKSVNVRELRLNECYRLTDESLNQISRSLPVLQILTLCGEGFRSISTVGLMNLDRLDNLIELRLDNNRSVTDAVLSAVAIGAPGLKILSLNQAGSDTLLTSAGLGSIARLTELTELNLCNLAGVTSRVMGDIAKNCPMLTVLRARSCTYLGDEGVLALKNCQNLTFIDISGCLLVTNKAIQPLLCAFGSSENANQLREVMNEKLNESGKSQNKKNKRGVETVTLAVGGSLCEASKLSMKGSRVVIDTTDYTSLSPADGDLRQLIGVAVEGDEQSLSEARYYSDEDICSDDEFESLTAQRSFVLSALDEREDSPIENETDFAVWAEREAKSLGLVRSNSKDCPK